MKKMLFIAAVVLIGMLTACTDSKQTKSEDNMQSLELTQEWDKVFPLSDKVNHRKVTFETQFGLTLAADLYDGGYTELVGKGEPKNLIPWDKLADFFNKNLK